MFNNRITFTIVERFPGPIVSKLFPKYSNPFRHSKIKYTRPHALVSLGQNREPNPHSKFFPQWSQQHWDKMRKQLRYGTNRA